MKEHGRNEFRFQVTLTVDRMDHKPFTVKDVIKEINPEQANPRVNRVDNILPLMKCLKKVRDGNRAHSALWLINREPGEICEGCHFYRILPKDEKLACGRIEKPFEPEEGDKTIFLQIVRATKTLKSNTLIKNISRTRSRY